MNPGGIPIGLPSYNPFTFITDTFWHVPSHRFGLDYLSNTPRTISREVSVGRGSRLSSPKQGSQCAWDGKKVLQIKLRAPISNRRNLVHKYIHMQCMYRTSLMFMSNVNSNV